MGSIRFLTGPLAGRTFPISKSTITIGREPNNDIVVPDPSISRHHAQLTWNNGLWTISKLSAQNTITVNQRAVEQDTINDRDTISLGAGITFLFLANAGVQRPSIPPPPQQAFLAPPPTKKRSQKLTGLSVGGVLGTIGAIIVILQFLGVTRIQDLFIHPTPTPAPLPVIAETTYDTVSPGCDTSKDPPDIVWQLNSAARGTCASNDSGTNLVQTDLRYVPALLFEAANGHELASNQTISADLTNIADNVCAGIGTRQNKKDNAGYAFYICGDGKWYILEYSKQGGTPVVLAQSTSATQENASDHYALVITVDNSNLQMAITGGQTHTVQNSDYTLTEIVSIEMSEEAVLTTYQSADFAASITVSHFHYQQS